MVAKSSLNVVGQKYKGFKVVKAVEITELQCFLRELVHESSGARVLHLANDDPENLFCLSFQTLPYNSNGVAHILEHTVLCGSKKYPVKDPFFAMNRRSLNTFMNALTGSDFTCYPASSQVHKDFYNLLEVYLDAVFHPNLNELSFLQEGHRLEFAKPDDPTSPLEHKGIVYNEMKGALSSAGARLAEAINKLLFAGITYGNNSGGDPKEIPSLTYQELLDFHHKYYHRSRCLFFFYGNMPLEDHLDFIDTHALNDVQIAPPLPPIPLQTRFKKPVYHEMTYPIAIDEEIVDKDLMAFGWLTCQILEQEDVLALSILEIILMDTDASPLKMALLKSGWCKQASSFIDVELNEIPWGIILKGVNPHKTDALEHLLFETLRTVVKDGIPIQAIENAIHQLEFYRSEITGDQAPFGLSLFMRSGLMMQHGADPEQGLRIHTLFDKLRKYTLSNPKYFSRLIEKYLLENSHYIRIVIKPDRTQGARENEEERKLLDSIKKSLTNKQTDAIVKKAAELSKFQAEQEEEQNFDVLPKVTLEDIPLLCKDYPMTEEKIGKLTVFHRAVFTNDIVYADLIFDLPDFTEEDLSYLRLLTIMMPQVGNNQRGYVANLEYIQGNTGGLDAGISLNLQASDHNLFYPTFHMRGKALHRKVSKLFPLMDEMINHPNFDEPNRLKEILLKHFTGLEGRISQSALKYAINLSASGLNVASKVADEFYGLNYYWKIRDIVKNLDKEAPALLANLKKIHKKLSKLDNPHLVLSCSKQIYDELKDNGFYGLKDIEAEPYTKWKGNYPLSKVPSQGRIIASPVAFIGKVFPTVSYTHPDAPGLNLASFLFDNLTLHSKIREQGGAYGGGAVSNTMSGNFYFYSYRDPNVLSTIKAFEEAVRSIANGDFDETDLEETKFEMVQALDSPISPGSQAELAYGWLKEGKTVEVRQAFRDKILALKREDVIHAVQKHIVPNLEKGPTVVFAGHELLEKANRELAADGRPPLPIEKI